MKKIAFMFAAAAMFVACGNKANEVVLDAADSAKAMEATVAEWNARAQAAADALTDDQIDFSAVSEENDSNAVREFAKKNAADLILAVADTTLSTDFADFYKAELAKILEAKKAPKAEGEQAPAEGEGEQK